MRTRMKPLYVAICRMYGTVPIGMSEKGVRWARVVHRFERDVWKHATIEVCL